MPADPLDVTHRIRLAGTLDIAGSVAGFARWGDDLIDRWDGTRLVRTVRIEGRVVPYSAIPLGTAADPQVVLSVAADVDPLAVSGAVVASFVAGAGVDATLTALVPGDPVVAALDRRFPGIRPVLQRDLFTAVVRSISAQQVNLGWAATTRRRLAETFGVRHRIDGIEVISLHAEALAGVDPARVRELQFTNAKAAAIVGFAGAVARDRLSTEALAPLDDEDVIAALTEHRGIGRWTAEWLLARTLGRPRVVAGDLGVRKAVGGAYLGGRMPSEAEVRDLTAHWGAAAGVAQQLLLHALAEGVDLHR